MRKIFKAKKVKINLIFVFIVFVIITTIYFLSFFNKNISEVIYEIGEAKLKDISNLIVADTIKNNNIFSQKAEDVLIVNYDKSGYISTIDYNMELVYKYLNNLNQSIQSKINDVESGLIPKKYENENLVYKGSQNGLILFIPSGYAFNGALFSNLGPKIPVKLMFVGNGFVNFKTKATSYGLNNVLLELYVITSISNTIIYPNKTKNVDIVIETLVVAKAVEGKVPAIYGGNFSSQSEGITVPIK